MNSAWAALSDMFVMVHRKPSCHGRADLHKQGRLLVRNLRPVAASISAWLFDRTSNATTALICTPLWREYYGAIDLAVSPDVPVAEPPSKVATPVPSPAAEENPTSARWPRGD
jgi:hypothetical protein